NFPLREDGLKLGECQRVIFISILGYDHPSVYQKEIGVGGDAEFSGLPGFCGSGYLELKILSDAYRPLRTAELMHLQPASPGVCHGFQSPVRLMRRFIKGMIRILRPDADHLAGPREA